MNAGCHMKKPPADKTIVSMLDGEMGVARFSDTRLGSVRLRLQVGDNRN